MCTAYNVLRGEIIFMTFRKSYVKWLEDMAKKIIIIHQKTGLLICHIKAENENITLKKMTILVVVHIISECLETTVADINYSKEPTNNAYSGRLTKLNFKKQGPWSTKTS